MTFRCLVACLVLMLCLVGEEAIAVTAEEQRRILMKQQADLPKISAEQAYVLFLAKKILIVDSNGSGRFKERHCWGAVNIPAAMTAKVRLRVKKDYLIGVY